MKKMAKENLILICVSLIVTQLVVVHCNEEVSKNSIFKFVRSLKILKNLPA